VVAAVGALIYMGVRGSSMYYMTVAELKAQADTVYGDKIRLGATVADGSIKSGADGETRFVTDGANACRSPTESLPDWKRRRRRPPGKIHPPERLRPHPCLPSAPASTNPPPRAERRPRPEAKATSQNPGKGAAWVTSAT
jgi:hypothetical protein